MCDNLPLELGFIRIEISWKRLQRERDKSFLFAHFVLELNLLLNNKSLAQLFECASINQFHTVFQKLKQKNHHTTNNQ